MRARPEPITDEHELYERALKLLTQRSRSASSLLQLLQKRCPDPNLVQSVIDKCVAHHYLDDVKYALQFARARMERKRQGRRRIAQELRARGISEVLIQSTITKVFDSIDEEELLSRALEAKLKQSHGPWDERKTKRLYHQMVRAGFNTEAILRGLSRKKLAGLPKTEFAEEESV